MGSITSVVGVGTTLLHPDPHQYLLGSGITIAVSIRPKSLSILTSPGSKVTTCIKTMLHAVPHCHGILLSGT